MKPLRDYQAKAVADVRAAYSKGTRRVVLVMPTGTGKTRTGAELPRRAVERAGGPSAPACTVLWVVHRTELVDQACKALAAIGLRVGACSPKAEWPEDASAPVQVGTVQSFLIRLRGTEPVVLGVWDECHHAAEDAEEWAKLFGRFPSTRWLGLTATPERGNGSGLAPLWEVLVCGPSARWATENGYLVPCEIIRPAKILEPGQLALEPLEAYRQHGGGRQAIIFASTRDRAEHYAREFTDAGVPALSISYKTGKSDRLVALRGFRGGDVRVLANRYVLTEGTDLTMAKICILACHCGTAGGYLQRVGRILRPHEGLGDGMLIDLTGMSLLYGPPEEERLYSLDGKGIYRAAAACRVCQTPLPPEGYPCPRCHYDPTAPAGDAQEGAAPIITGDPLEKFARMIAQGPEARWQTCLRWVDRARDAAAKQGKEGPRLHSHLRSVRHKWRAVYGEELDSAWLLAAIEGQRSMP